MKAAAREINEKIDSVVELIPKRWSIESASWCSKMEHPARWGIVVQRSVPWRGVSR
jgi:hypothetical protein